LTVRTVNEGFVGEVKQLWQPHQKPV